MKKVLVTGAAGNVGLSVIRYLLAEGKYDITAIDLPNKYVYNRLKKYRKRINVVYGDILDGNTVYELIKNQDYIIHLASCLPPLANIKEKLSELIEVNGTESIVRAINFYNKKCMLIYASSTSIYNTNNPVSISNKPTLEGYYNIAKIKSEELITKHIKNYAILRLSLVVGDLTNNKMIYSVTKKDSVNKKILNIGGGDTCTVLFKDLKKMICLNHGIDSNIIGQSFYLSNKYYSPVLLDSNESNKLLDYQRDSFESVSMRIKRRNKKRVFGKFIGKITHLKKNSGESKW